MAVPKKKTSKGKRDQRHAHWKAKARVAARKALSLVRPFSVAVPKVSFTRCLKRTARLNPELTADLERF